MTRILFFFACFYMAGMAFSQSSPKTERIVLDSEYCNSYKIPIQLGMHDTLISPCASLFIINNVRFRLYEHARQVLLSQDIRSMGQDIISLRQDLERIKDKHQEYGATYDQLEFSYLSLINDQQTRMIRLKEELTKTQNDLELNQMRLKAVQDDLQKTARMNRMKHILFGTGGMLGGLLLGVLLSN